MPEEVEPTNLQYERVQRRGIAEAAILPTPAAGLPGDYEGSMSQEIYPSIPPATVTLPIERLRIVRAQGDTTPHSPLITEI